MDSIENFPAPLLKAMTGYVKEERVGFHMPGHRQGKGLPAVFHRLLTAYNAALDLTELAGLDNLAAPEESIRESLEAMANLAGSKQAYYLVNGATVGLEAAMMVMSSPDVPTIMPAHCHRAVAGGLVLSGSRPAILPCLVDEQWGLPIGVDREAAEAYLTLNMNNDKAFAKALWISLNPTYHGVMADLAWEKNILDKRTDWHWLVDEAHGVHLPYSKKMDADEKTGSALSYGAHIVVQSAHKMGTGFTQTGILHCNRETLSPKLEQALNVLQSSSPSYLLLASLDAWQAFLQREGKEELQRAEDLALEIADRIRNIGGFRLWQDECRADYPVDPRKITLSSRDLGISGIVLADVLRKQYQIDVEMATPEYLLLIVNIGHNEADAAILIKALGEIRDRTREIQAENQPYMDDKARNGQNRSNSGSAAAAGIYRAGKKALQPVITPREAYFKDRREVRLEQAAGHLAAVPVTPYPPGIPLVFPGMEITKEETEAIRELHKEGRSCAGLKQIGDQLWIEVIEDRNA